MNKNIIVEVIEVPVGFTKPIVEVNMFSCMPPDIAMAMFDEMIVMQELIDRGERCEKCGELHLPEEMSQGLCSDCLMELEIMYLQREEEREVERMVEEYLMQQFLETVMWR